MTDHFDSLTQEEELELAELEKNGKNRRLIKVVLTTCLSLIILVLIYGMFMFFPFNAKIKGVWIDTQSGTYKIENKGSQSSFRINSLNGNSNLSLVMNGELYATAANRYKVKNVVPYLEVSKSGIANQTLEELRANEDAYTVEKETDDILLLKYTDATIESAFPDNQLETLFYYEYSSDLLFRSEVELKLRNSSFADPTISFVKS